MSDCVASKAVWMSIEARKDKKCRGVTFIPLERDCLYVFTNAQDGSKEANSVKGKVVKQYSSFDRVKYYSTTEVCLGVNEKKPIRYSITLPLNRSMLTVRVIPMNEENLAFVFRIHHWKKRDMGSFGMIHWGCHKGNRERISLYDKLSGLKKMEKEGFDLLHVHKVKTGDDNNAAEEVIDDFRQ